MARLFTASFRITLLTALLAAGAMSLALTHARPVTRVEALVARQAPPAVSRSEFFRPGVDVAAGQMCNWAGTWTGTDGPQTLTMTVSSGVGTVRGRWGGGTSSDATNDSFQGTARGDGTHLDNGTWYNGNHGGTMDYTMAADCNSFSGNRYECYQGGAASVPAGQSGPQAPRFCSSGNFTPDRISYQRSSGSPTVPIAASSTGGSTNTNTGSTGNSNTSSTGGTTPTNCSSGFSVGVANPGCTTGATGGQQQPPPCSFNNPRNAAGNCPTPVPCLVDNSMHTPPNDPCPQGPLPACPGGVLRNSDGTCPPPPPCPGGVVRNPDGSCPQGTLCLDMVTTIYPPKTTDDCPKGTPCPDLVTTIYPTNPAQTCPPGTLCPDNATTIYPNNPLTGFCPLGTKCFDGSYAYSTAIPPQTCPSGGAPTINSVTCTPAEFSIELPKAQSVDCSADVSAVPGSPVTSWSWRDTSSLAAGVGSPGTGGDPTFSLTFSQAVAQPTQSVANLVACSDAPPSADPPIGGAISSCASRSATITIDAAPTGCRVDVRSRPVEDTRGYFDHLFIIFTDQSGKPTVFRGGSEAVTLENEPRGPFGLGPYPIEVVIAPYRPGSVDWTPDAPSITVENGPVACSTYDSFTATATAINRHGTAYTIVELPYLEHNSNSVAYTMLYYAGIPPQKPDGSTTPGWGNLLDISPP